MGMSGDVAMAKQKVLPLQGIIAGLAVVLLVGWAWAVSPSSEGLGIAARPGEQAPVSMPRLVADTQPAATQPVATRPAASQPTSQPATAPATQPYDDGLTAETIETTRQQVLAATDLPKEEREVALDLCAQALAQLKIADDWRARIARCEEAVAKIPEQLERARAKLAQPVEDLTPVVPDNADLSQIEQLAAQAAEADRAAMLDVTALNREQQDIQDRRQNIPARQAAIRQTQAQLSEQIQAATAGTSVVDGARVILLRASRRALWREFRALDRQAALDKARQDLLTVQIDLANRYQRQTHRAAGLWSEILTQHTAAEAAKVAAQASRQSTAVQDQPELFRIAEQSRQLAQQRVDLQALASRIQASMQSVDEIRRQRRAVGDDYEGMVKRINTIGLTEAISSLLRRHRAQLPDIARHERNWRRLEAEYSRVQMELIDLEDQRAALVDLDRCTDEILKSIKAAAGGEDRQALRDQVRDLVQTKRKYLDDLINEYNACAKTWLEMEEEDRLLIAQTRKYADFIEEHILWVRSTRPLQPASIRPVWSALGWLGDPTAWKGVASASFSSFRGEPFACLFGLTLLVLLLASRPRLRSRLETIDRIAAKGSSYAFVHTLEAMLLTFLLAVTWPGLMWFAGWRLSAALTGNELTSALAAGLRAAGLLYLCLELARQICRKGGLGRLHFHWHDPSLHLLQRNLAWLIPATVPLTLLLVMLDTQPAVDYKDSLGRLLFVADMLLAAVFARNVLRPSAPLIAEFIQRHADGWTDRLRYIWYPLIVAAPVVLALAAAIGYFYTAVQLADRLLATAGLVFTAFVIRALLLRLLFVGRRTLAIEEARKRQVAAAESRDAAASTSPLEPASAVLPAASPTAAHPQIDLAAVDVQTRRLVRAALLFSLAVGLYVVWADVLPALGILDRVTLWSTTTDATQFITGPDGGKIAQTVQKVVPITLGSLALAGLIVLGAVAAARNIPGLLEITILRLLPLEPAGRYAINAVSRYIITTAGLIVAFGVIGIGWSKVQWLVAAMTVGLGFGLQEIFANFVSGLIILFERPVRVGDIVTVGSISGTVSKIHIRATTIVDWDRKELIVPNKEFITSQLINWTLSDKTLRVVVPVGVAYGSDTCRVQELLLKVARENPRVLDDPAPQALFLGFGESSLDFSLRVFVPNPAFLASVQHDLHMAIDKAFRQAGIEIAFPQRDLNIRNVNLGAILPALAAQRDTPS